MLRDESIGLRAYLSESSGIGGTLKDEPDDFLVEEITPDGTILEIGKSISFESTPGDYTCFTVEKKNWDTMRAAKEIGRRCSLSHTRINFAGTKDRRAISAQRMSAWKIPVEKLEKVSIKDITIRDFSQSAEPISLGTLKGNRFTVTLKGVSNGADKEAQKIVSELGGKTPNFYGSQRFGIRYDNHIIGKLLLMGDIKGATLEHICGVGEPGDEPEEATNARNSLKETMDFKAAFNSFPNYLGFEKSVINHLARVPTDFAGALREVPKKLRWMFIHAYQGYVFNRALSEHIKSGDVPESLPLAGYAIDLDPITARLLEEDGIKPENFKLPSMPELAMEGVKRDCLVEFSGFEILDFNEADSNLRMKFSLPTGAYATMLLREIMKN